MSYKRRRGNLRISLVVELGSVAFVVDAGTDVAWSVDFPELGFPWVSCYVDGHFVVIFKTVFQLLFIF